MQQNVKSGGTLARLGAVLMLLAALIAGSAPPAAAEPATFAIDRAYTNVSFSWNHLGLSRQSARILDVEGSLTLDMEKPEDGRLEVMMKAGSIATGVPEFDRLLKGVDFFDAGRNPIITFKSTAIRKTSEKTGEVTGDLMIMGIIKPVTLDVTLNFAGEHPLGPINAIYRDKFVAGFSAKAKLSRTEWGLKRGTPLISDEVEITIEAELNRK